MNSDCFATDPDSSSMAARRNNATTTREFSGVAPKEKNPPTTLSREDSEDSDLEDVEVVELPAELIPLTTAGLGGLPPTASIRLGSSSKAQLLSPFAIPSKRYHGKRTRLVHGHIRVVNADNPLAATKIYFDLQDKHDNQLRFPCLMAVKHCMNRKYDIYDISWGMQDDNDDSSSNRKSSTGQLQQDEINNNKVGTLEKVLFQGVGKIVYKLCNENGVEESRISFRLNSPMDFVTDKVTPGRKCEIVLMADKAGRSKRIKEPCVMDDEMKKPKAKKYNTTRTSNDDDAEPQHLHHRLLSKIPDKNVAALDFKGRGRQASTKNAQLVDTAAQGGKVVLQMAKVEKGVFHLDYRAPCSAFHAFAFALAQLDL